MIYVFYSLALVLIFFSYRSFRGGFEYLRFFRSELAKPVSEHTPFTSIFAPCKGLDHGLAENLSALLVQDHPAYEVVFVVDDDSDAAVDVINTVSTCSTDDQVTKPSTKLVIAPRSAGSSQKVENLREAVLHASDRSEVFVFVDSDVRPDTGWLRALIAPLADSGVGAATGYRWFIANDPTFGSELRSAWNASIASALGPNPKTNFCWGGSMALRRDVFERIRMRDEWLGTLSDDFAVTRTVRSAGLPIIFVPQALSATLENCTFREMLEFTTRQMKITRVYSPGLWKLSFFGSAVFTFVLTCSFLIVVFSRSNSLPVWISLAVMLLVTVFSVGKAWLRLRAVELVLERYRDELRSQFWTQCTLWLLAAPVFLYNAFAALISRRMTWRGIRYELKSPRETVIIAD